MRYHNEKHAEVERRHVERLSREKGEQSRALRGAMKMAPTREERQAIAKIYGPRLRTTSKKLGIAESKLRKYERARLTA